MTSDFHRPRRRRPHVPLIQPGNASLDRGHPHPALRPTTSTEKWNNYFHIFLKQYTTTLVPLNPLLVHLKNRYFLRLSPPRQKHAPCHTYLPRKRGPKVRRRGQLYCSIRRGRRAGAFMCSGWRLAERDARSEPVKHGNPSVLRYRASASPQARRGVFQRPRKYKLLYKYKPDGNVHTPVICGKISVDLSHNMILISGNIILLWGSTQ